MPKKTPGEVKERAKSLYVSGRPVKEIAAELGLSVNTVKTWRRRGGWAAAKPGKPEPAGAKDPGSKGSGSKKESKPKKGSGSKKESKPKKDPGSKKAVRKGSRPHRVTEKSLRNLRPPFEKGNKAALKHGIYADHSSDPAFLEVMEDSAGREPIDLVREQIDQLRANIVLAQAGVDPQDPATLQAIARVSETLVRSVDKFYAIQRANADPDGERLSKVDRIMAQLDEEAGRVQPDAE